MQMEVKRETLRARSSLYNFPFLQDAAIFRVQEGTICTICEFGPGCIPFLLEDPSAAFAIPFESPYQMNQLFPQQMKRKKWK